MYTMRLMNQIEYASVDPDTYRSHMRDFTRATSCVRLHQGQPIENVHGIGQAVDFASIQRASEPSVVTLFGNLQVECLTEESPTEFAIRRSNIGYLEATLPNGIHGFMALETIDERRQNNV